MTNPLQRVAESLVTTTLTGGRVLTPRQALDVLQIVFDSIDINELADVILEANLIGDRTAMGAAHAVKNWLTGKERTP